MPAKYIAEISPVREVSLLGRAELDFWTNRLRQQQLVPAAADGRAQLLISGVNSQYMGIPFRELSISVLVQNRTGGQDDEYFLAHAYNSSRLLAFFERKCFSTPYEAAPLQVEIGPPAAIELGDESKLLRAETSAGRELYPQSPIASCHECLEITIHLPSPENSRAKPKLFFARLAGDTTRFPYFPSRDIFSLQPSNRDPVVGWLIDSHFVAKEWIIRASATHARSNTFDRN